MKDYTKYDFAAIKGAYVEIKTKSGEPVRGTLIDFNFNLAKAPIYIHESSNYVTGIPIAEIESLSAKIKVEDMSVKQLKRVLDEDVYNSIVFSRDENVIYEQMEIASELSGDYIERKFNDYIDCTEWGWKHE